MLTPERQLIILSLLKEKGVVKLQELVEETNASESTIRRDLIQLEEQRKLKRVHGGASLLQGKRTEPSLTEKTFKNLQDKINIAKAAASFIQDGDSIFLDAGTTTQQMISFLEQKKLTVVTNGITLVDPLLEKGITTYLLGGMVKGSTRAIIGRSALDTLKTYRFDKCFIGTNGVDVDFGYTTPDPEEALIKQVAIELSQEGYVLADQSKIGEVSFSKIADLEEAVLVTNQDSENIQSYQQHTSLKVVTT
ncbi:DeoR/GlpR transcriptional regulator [Rossellomorea vietnamensis]|uniref:DeoR/GlpR transcriptional regulator n=2 Tax=Rossellomorea TaxID=2837508 RepID=A0A5D4KD34_9BACI|nr:MULTISPECIES: DeoR/GlpR family DNA-binding transcription regulator [Rossellomorea]TYR75102.1 DeoR/GlpR transcriptional regulator [Rossellomorea vietnamensis]TYS79858.1 DeoR/GlpR transcriptional regulator [Rossellomorea aquimaris]